MSDCRSAAVFALFALTSGAQAQDLPLAPLSNYGKVAIAATQSAGGYIAFEQAFGGEFDAEPASNYPETSELRRLGRAVGRLDVAFPRGVGYCTAFLISDSYLMTNAHCLEGGQPQAISFITGYVESGVETGTRTYTVGTTPVEISPSDDLDYAILQVFGNPAADWGTVRLAAREIDATRDAGMPLMVLGHPVFQVAPVPVPQPLYISRKECQATATNPRAGKKLRHTCDTLGGNSGSPVFSDDTREVIALHHAGSPREGINFAIPISLIARDSTVVAGLLARAPDPAAPDLAALQSELEKLRAERDAARAEAEAEAKRLAEELAALQADRARPLSPGTPAPTEPVERFGLAPGDLGLRIEVDGDAEGTVVIDLFEDVAPRHAERIAALARFGAYNGVVFHRVIDGFMAQTGDVQYGDFDDKTFTLTVTGSGRSDLPDVEAEFSDIPFERGVVGMARSQDPDSANAQFFIMFKDAAFLNGQYTVVGKVIQGMDIIDRVKRGEPLTWAKIGTPDRMTRVTVIE